MSRSYARREDVDSKPWMSLPAFQALWARAVEVLQLNADTIGVYTGWLENSAAKLLPSVSTGSKNLWDRAARRLRHGMAWHGKLDAAKPARKQHCAGML